MLDLVRAATGSTRGWIALKCGSLAEEAIRDLVRADMGSCSPLDLAATWIFLEIISVCCWDSPLQVVTMYLPWSPLEVGAGERSRAGFGNGAIVLGVVGGVLLCGKRVDRTEMFASLQRFPRHLQWLLVGNFICCWVHL